MVNLWEDLETGPNPPEEIYAVVECLKGERNKYEYDKSVPGVVLDRVLHSNVHYPSDYGFIPQSYYDDEVNHGRLYPNLDDLVEMGLVEKSELDKRTNQYALTDEGYQALLDQFAWSFNKLIVDEDRAADLGDLIERYR